jgi:nucleoside-diphosphate-sugar epimerase
VFHLAVHGAYSSQTAIHEMIDTNIVSTVHLVEACLQTGFEAFVNTGSSSEYGFKDHPPSESEWLEPNSAYAVTKASATLYCRMIAQTRRENVTTLRLYSVYGAYEEPTRLIPTLIAHGLRGRLPPLVNPNIARDFVYVEDVNDAYLKAAAPSAASPVGEYGAVYNVGSGVQTTLRDAVEVARRVLNIEQTPEWGSMPDRNWDTSVWIADPRAVRQALGWQATTPFERGFQAMVEWLQAHPNLYSVYGLE